MSGRGEAAGPAEFKEGVRRVCGLFPDFKMVVEDTVCEGDKVAARWSATFTHTGVGRGEPTGKRFQVTGISVSQWRDGRVLYGWNAQDFTAIFDGLPPAD